MSTTAPEHAFPTLTNEQIEALQAYGRPVSYPKGKAVWKAGDADVCMFVVVRGGIQVVDGRTGRPIVRHGVGNFSGDIDVITGRPSIVSAIADENSELLVMQGDCVRRIAASSRAWRDHPPRLPRAAGDDAAGRHHRRAHRRLPLQRGDAPPARVPCPQPVSRHLARYRV